MCVDDIDINATSYIYKIQCIFCVCIYVCAFIPIDIRTPLKIEQLF